MKQLIGDLSQMRVDAQNECLDEHGELPGKLIINPEYKKVLEDYIGVIRKRGVNGSLLTIETNLAEFWGRTMDIEFSDEAPLDKILWERK